MYQVRINILLTEQPQLSGVWPNSLMTKLFAQILGDSGSGSLLIQKEFKSASPSEVL